VGRVIKSAETPIEVTTPAEMPMPLKASVIELAVAMAKRIVEVEIQDNPAVLDKVFARALLFARGMEAAEVRVHPTDRAAFDVDGAAATYGFTVLSDESVGRAGCRIVGRYGEIDASIETLMDAFQTALEEAR
jgi:flagellar biosynthesis/type III secretory pathway protein FliH